MNKNSLLEDRIREHVRSNPGLIRRQIARGLQKEGLRLKQQHISNRTGELIAYGELQERINEMGQQLVFPVPVKEVHVDGE